MVLLQGIKFAFSLGSFVRALAQKAELLSETDRQINALLCAFAFTKQYRVLGEFQLWTVPLAWKVPR
jgi:hypothetical protein